MSLALLAALVAGAMCLGILSSLVPLARREADGADELPLYEDDFFDVGGPIIDLEPRR
jgi:hypothetical protein